MLFLKIYNYFVRGVVLFLLIIIPFTIVTNPEMIKDEVDFYFFCYSIYCNPFELCGMDLYL